MQTGSGPAAVTLLFSVNNRKEPFRSLRATVLHKQNGKVTERAGEPEDLPGNITGISATDRAVGNLKGSSKLGAALQTYSGLKGFFYSPDTGRGIYQEGHSLAGV